MATDLIMPQLDMSMTEGQLAEWIVEDGETVAEGQVIYTIEADKATQEVESPAAGTLRHIAVPGETYKVSTKLGEIV